MAGQPGRTRDEDGAGGDERGGKQPSLRQQRVLDRYYELANAAAVARDVGLSERQVRRIIPLLRCPRSTPSSSRGNAKHSRRFEACNSIR
jgi:hypothetical protein